MPKNVAPDKTLEAFTTQAFASTFSPNITDAAIVKVTLTGNITSLTAPTGRSFGIFTIVFVQDATGGRTLTWNTTDYPDMALVNWNPCLPANEVSSISFFYDSNSSKWRVFSSFNGDVWMGLPVGGGTPSSTNVLRIGDQTLFRSATGTISASANLAGGNVTATSGALQGGTVQGGTGSGGNMTLTSTSSGTKGKIFLGSGGVNSAFDETNKRLGIGNVSPTVALDITGAGLFSSTVTHAEPTTSTHSATKNYVDQRQLGSLQSTATAIGTTITATGLSISNVPAGSWSIYAYVPIVTVGTTMSCTINLSPSSGPTVTSLFYNWNRTALTTTLASSAQNTVMPAAAGSHAFNTNTSIYATTATAGTYLLELQGGMVSTTTGTLSISMTRTGGTSITVQKGAYLRLERLA